MIVPGLMLTNMLARSPRASAPVMQLGRGGTPVAQMATATPATHAILTVLKVGETVCQTL